MKWTSIESKIITIKLEVATKTWSTTEIESLINDARQAPIILYPDAIRKKIMEHVQHQNVELGGLLIGSIVCSEDSPNGLIAIAIRDAIPSIDCESSAVSLTMSPKVWQSANSELGAQKLVIGWYHSHPNLGAFFSCVDKKTQKDFLNKEYNLALVVDPLKEEEKWFIGADAAEIEANRIRCDDLGLNME